MSSLFELAFLHGDGFWRDFFGWAITTRRDENCDDASASVDGEIYSARALVRRWERGDKTRQVQPTCRGLIAASLCGLETATSSRQSMQERECVYPIGRHDGFPRGFLGISTNTTQHQEATETEAREKQQPTHMNLVGRSGPGRARPTSLFERGHARCNLRRQEIRSCGPSRLAAYTNAPWRNHKLWVHRASFLVPSI